MNFFYEYIFIVPCIAYIIATIFKWFYIKFTTDKKLFASIFDTWWMPSQHSAFVSSLAIAILLKNWLNSDLFAVALVFAIIVIYDSCHLRYEAWLHAKAINKLQKTNDLNESLWHTKIQVIAWTLVWIVVSVILYLL